MVDCDPLGVILVSSGSRGDRLLFRYPFDGEEDMDAPYKFNKGEALFWKCYYRPL